MIKSWNEITDPQIPQIFVGRATCGDAAGAGETQAAIEAFLSRNGLKADIHITGCLGFCFAEPLVDIILPGKKRITFKEVTSDKVDELLSSYLVNGVIPQEMVLGAHEEGAGDLPLLSDHPFMKHQVRLALRNCGIIDPTDISHYLSRNGYSGLKRALSMSQDDIINEVEASGLRGRGGAGFPTARKWRFCRDAEGSPKYIICNADEGDPGAFMNRALLESDPHAVLEGIIIGAYAIGASRGYIYTRAEYPLAIKRLMTACEQARENNLLGDNILGSGFSFDIELVKGAGAFVCGEETALIASIEGKRGNPRQRPPFPAVSGLFGKPTNINNVESWAHVSQIMQNGASSFNKYGTAASKGTKTFSLTGKIQYTGLIEVPLGTTLDTIVNEIGKPLPDDEIKGIQIGGPAGGCIPTYLFHTAVDYEELTKCDAIMGSGGIVVLDWNDCIVDTALYFLNFTENESCGKCTPCKLGSHQMQLILKNIVNGQGTAEDLESLADLGEMLRKGSLCALGQGIPNPVISAMRHFGQEFTDHIENKHCEAHVCKALLSYQIDPAKCRACGRCVRACPKEAIYKVPDGYYVIDQDKCIRCGACLASCPKAFGGVKLI